MLETMLNIPETATLKCFDFLSNGERTKSLPVEKPTKFLLYLRAMFGIVTIQSRFPSPPADHDSPLYSNKTPIIVAALAPIAAVKLSPNN